MKSVKKFDYTRKDLIELHKIVIGCFVTGVILNKMLVCNEKATLAFTIVFFGGTFLYTLLR